MEQLIWVDVVSKVCNFITHLENKVHDKLNPVLVAVWDSFVVSVIIILLLFPILPILALFPLSRLTLCYSATTLGKLLKIPLVDDYVRYMSRADEALTYNQYVWVYTNRGGIEGEGKSWYELYHSESGRCLRVRQTLKEIANEGMV
jgi:hypothetical protein